MAGNLLPLVVFLDFLVEFDQLRFPHGNVATRVVAAVQETGQNLLLLLQNLKEQPFITSGIIWQVAGVHETDEKPLLLLQSLIQQPPVRNGINMEGLIDQTVGMAVVGS